MNNTRIRYNQVAENELQSARVFSLVDDAVGSRYVVVELNIVDNKFVIKDASTSEIIVSGGKTKNISVLKIQAKRALKKLGVDFESEKRNKIN